MGKREGRRREDNIEGCGRKEAGKGAMIRKKRGVVTADVKE